VSLAATHGVQANGQVLGNLGQIGVSREDSHPVAHSDGANQQVRGGALDAFAATGV